MSFLSENFERKIVLTAFGALAIYLFVRKFVPKRSDSEKKTKVLRRASLNAPKQSAPSKNVVESKLVKGRVIAG